MAFIKTYLCTAEFLKANSFINNNVEDSIVKVAMQRVQRNNIEPLLGTALYDKLIADIKAGTVAGNYEVLLDEYVLPVYIAWVEYKLAPHQNTEIRNKAVGKSGDNDITPATDTELGRIREQYRNDAKVLENKLIGYLCENNTLFAEYTSGNDGADKVKPNTGHKYGKTSFLI
jgi:hypothetical protein